MTTVFLVTFCLLIQNKLLRWNIHIFPLWNVILPFRALTSFMTLEDTCISTFFIFNFAIVSTGNGDKAPSLDTTNHSMNPPCAFPKTDISLHAFHLFSTGQNQEKEWSYYMRYCCLFYKSLDIYIPIYLPRFSHYKTLKMMAVAFRKWCLYHFQWKYWATAWS